MLLKKYDPKFIFLFVAIPKMDKQNKWLDKRELTLNKRRIKAMLKTVDAELHQKTFIYLNNIFMQ